MAEKTKVSDFRYNSGASQVPWAAVGEPIRKEDILRVLRVLVRPGDRDPLSYETQLDRVGKEVARLLEVGRHAGKLTLGTEVSSLESKISEFLGCKHTCFLPSWTSGLEILCKYVGLKPGDEVIAPAITFAATIAPPMAKGAKIVLADLDPRTLNMDPADVARKITPRTKLIIPVHIGGYPADMDALMALAEKHDITVFEDAAHAFGASYKGRMCGSIGHFGAFSFHEVKNVTSLGEGGALCTSLPFGEQFGKARFLGLDFTRQIPDWLYDVTAVEGKEGSFVAGNHSVTEVQAAVLSSQMDRMGGIIAKRRKAAEYLNGRLQNVEGLITPPLDDDDIVSSHHLYLLQVDPAKLGANIQALKPKLAERGIVQIPHFAPLYKFSLMKEMGYDTDALAASCPVAEEAFGNRFTHLPLYDYNDEQLKYMADSVISATEDVRAG